MIDTERKAFYVYIGTRIALIRKTRNLNQENLANKIKRSRVSVVNIEKGRQMPSTHLLWKIAYTLGVTPNDLYPPTDPKKLLSSDTLIEEVEKQENISEAGKNSLTSFLEKL